MNVGLWLFVALSFAISSVAACVRPFNSLTDAVAGVNQTRTVKDRTLTSTQMPAVRLEFSQPFRYAGGHSFILYEVANAEQHFFVGGGALGLGLLVPVIFYKMRKPSWKQPEPQEVTAS